MLKRWLVTEIMYYLKEATGQEAEEGCGNSGQTTVKLYILIDNFYQ